MNKWLAIAVVAATFSLNANAGVSIYDDGTTGTAYGQFNSAADPAHLNAYLYCQLFGGSIYCGASDDAGHYASCSSSEPALKKLFPMIRKISLLQFYWDASRTCTRIDVNNGRDLEVPPVQGAMKAPTPVYINTAARYAYGTVAAMPSSSSNAIGCTAQSLGSIYCTARDHAGNFIWCAVTRDSASQTLADQMLATAGINESSLVYFSWDNDPGKSSRTCNFLYTINASYYLP